MQENPKLRLFTELAGAISIVLSLIFVGMELRHANNLAEAEAIGALNESVRDIATLIASDIELASIIEKYSLAEITEDDLSHGQRGQIKGILKLWSSLGESSWKYFDKEIITDQLYQDYIQAVCLHYKMFPISGYWKLGSEYYAEAYADDVEETCPTITEI